MISIPAFESSVSSVATCLSVSPFLAFSLDASPVGLLSWSIIMKTKYGT